MVSGLKCINKDFKGNYYKLYVICFSDYFEHATGLRQSPVMFSLFVEDLELFLQNDINSGLHIDYAL